jgi:hypothetical protein
MTLDDPLAEALRLVDHAAAQGLALRLMGGLAFHALVPTWTARIDRDGRDIDLATRKRDRKAVATLLAEQGYTPDREYNALHGHKQLYFVDAAHRRPLDLLVDRLDMCHRFDFGDRLGLATPTLPPSDLLLTKLQIVKLNRKDALDALILLSEFRLADDDGTAAEPAINRRRIAGLTASDWGWWRTVTGNLDRLSSFVETDAGPNDFATDHPPPFDARTQVAALRAAIDAASKSPRWQVRSRVGDRMRWYEEPEEIAHEG